MDHDKLMDNFVEESFGHLTKIESGLIELERLGDGADYSLVNGVFRSIHTIKGASGFLGLNNIGLLTHVMEDSLSLLREKKLRISKELAAALFQGTDVLKSMLDDVNSSDSMCIDIEIENISQASGIGLKNKKKVRVKEKLSGGKTEQLVFDVPETELQDLIQQGSYLYFIRVYLKKDLTSKGQTPFDFINNMESTGRFLDAFLDLSVIGGLGDCLEAEMAFVFIYATVLEPDLVPLALDLPADRITEIEIEYLRDVYQHELTRFLDSFPQDASEKDNIEVSSDSQDDEIHQSRMLSEERLSMADERLRVRVDALDDLMNLASELIVGRNQLAQIVQPFINNTAGLEEGIKRISRLSAEIREKIILMRMQPVSMLFGRYNRFVRDIANLLGKDVVLQTSGDEVELEKTIIEALSGPITHIIRNCLDHGIEMPELRRKAGKSSCGLIRLSAFYGGSSVNIEVIDDGAGIDLFKIREKALETNIVTREKLAEMSDKDILKLIFAPGFSTAEQVSDISGRGVGMDVVKTEIERIGGYVDIETRSGKGTLIRMTLPLKLAVISGLGVKVCGQFFIMPESDIAELVKLEGPGINQRIITENGVNVFALRDVTLPIFYLKDLLGIIPEEEISAPNDLSGIIVVKTDGFLFGVVVDEIGEVEEIAVKPLPRFFCHMKWFSGTTILADGSVSMILDVKGMLEKSGLDLSVQDVMIRQ